MDKNLLDDARSLFVSLFMDGRNEHGTHLLEMNTHSIPGHALEALCSIDLDPLGDLAEHIFRSAERIGFSDGSTVVALFHFEKGDFENDGYFEFVRISEPLTKLFWGDPSEQSGMDNEDKADG